MITSLLSKKPVEDLRTVGASPGIEVVPSSDTGAGSGAGGSRGGGGEGEGEGESGEESDEFDWQVEQQLPAGQDLVRVLDSYTHYSPTITYMKLCTCTCRREMGNIKSALHVGQVF